MRINDLQNHRLAAQLLLPESGMKRLTVDDLRAMLPALDELRPLVDRLLAESKPDPTRAWSGSGILGSAGDRLVDMAGLATRAAELEEEEHRHRMRVHALISRALTHVDRGEPDGAAEAFLEAARLEEERDRPREAEAYADAAHRVARDSGMPELISRTLRRRARHRRALGRYDESAGDYKEAYVTAEALGDPGRRGAAEALIGRGNVLEEQGRWSEAAEQYLQALEVIGAESSPTPERWHAELNLHVVLRSMGRLDAAVPHLDRAGLIAEELGDSSARPFLENARGQLAMARGSFEAAERHLREAVDASSGARAEVTIRINLAETLLAVGRTLDAAEEARRAERRAIVGRAFQKLPEIYRLLGRIAAREGVSDAFVLFERSLEIIRDRGLPALERALTLQAYGEAEARRGDREASDRLLAEADDVYRELGVAHRRRPWADRFDDGSESTDLRTDDG